MPDKDEAAEHSFAKERQLFLPLLLSNPNYFGTLKNTHTNRWFPSPGTRVTRN